MKNNYFFSPFFFLISALCSAQTIYSVSGTIGTPIPNTWDYNLFIGTLSPPFVTTSQTTIYIDKNVVLNDSIVIPENVTLKFVSGSVITLDDYNLTFYGSIEAGTYQIFNCNKKGRTYGLPIVDKVFPQWWKRPEDGIYWHNAIQCAVDFYPKVFFPPLNGSVDLLNNEVSPSVEVTNYAYAYTVSKPIKLDLSKRIPSGYILSGVGRGSYFSTNTKENPFEGYVFTCINVPKGGYQSGLVFENLTFFCENGIALADCDSNGIPKLYKGLFESESTAILKAEINNCIFRSTTQDKEGTAILFIKVFDSEISKNYINGFKYGIRLLGSDINQVHDNRIEAFTKYAIFERSYTTKTNNVGSQNAIIHNDLLTYKGPEKENAFIKSNANHIVIRDNYLENQQNANKVFAYIDCSMLGMKQDDQYDDNNGDEVNIDKGIGIQPHSAFHIDVTGNRCDATNSVTENIYYIDQYFKSLNLIEIPIWGSDVPNSFFAKMEVDENGRYKGVTNPNNFIDMKLLCGDVICNKLINMVNCQSFKNWENFSSTNNFTNSSNGDIIIDPKSISYVSRTNFRMPVFNPRSFRLERAEGAAWPDIVIYIDQNAADNELGDLFENFDLLLKVRNLADPTDAVHSVADDLFINIEDMTAGELIYQNYSIDVPSNNTNSTAVPNNNYMMIRVVLPETLKKFDSSHRYKLTIASRSNSIKEFKEIILSNKKVFEEIDHNTPEQEKKQKEIPTDEEGSETIQTLTVKVDNDVKVAPNPVKSNLEIKIKEGDVLKKVEIYAENGAFIKDYTNEIEEGIIDVSNLPNAVYIVKVTSVSNTSKIIIKK
ncbi:T9SS type A sorting domain-containing protein [Flavobacterium mekongense]|uniref:T9SS type A sorting domain-containing protein n=1 Tax=Flavobacterium mekongense TaxID=3379707 RepID=UPI00399C3FD5